MSEKIIVSATSSNQEVNCLTLISHIAWKATSHSLRTKQRGTVVPDKARLDDHSIFMKDAKRWITDQIYPEVCVIYT